MLPTNNEQKHFAKAFEEEADLFDRLENYCGCGYVPMHMPGHKRNTQLIDIDNPYGIDITEIDGFDNLHHPEGFLKEAQERAAQYYGAAKTWYLVSGSSIGLMSAIFMKMSLIHSIFIQNLWITCG